MPTKDPLSRIKAALRAHQGAADPLEKLRLSQRIREAAEELEVEDIQQARDNGATWRDIGACYGLSKQGAQQRFKVTRPQEPTGGHRQSGR